MAWEESYAGGLALLDKSMHAAQPLTSPSARTELEPWHLGAIHLRVNAYVIQMSTALKQQLSLTMDQDHTLKSFDFVRPDTTKAVSLGWSRKTKRKYGWT